MCRISGSVGYPQNIVGQATLKQRRGGPDHTDCAQLDFDPNVYFGHNRLSIIDLTDQGNQPMTTGRYSMVYNGEVFNYKDLGIYRNDSIAVISHIEKVGFEKALQSFNGMFAIAIYDHHFKKIYLACDRFGQKPLYYFQDGNKFAFASSPAALYHIKDKWELDREALQSYWLLGSVMGEDSLMKGIKKLTGSHMAEFDCLSSKLTLKRYYTPTFQMKTDEIEELVLDSVRKVQVSDVPIHIFLSGGIDSTIVASQFKGGKAVHLESPEEKYAQEAADKFGIDLKIIKSGEIDVEQCLTDFNEQFGEPSAASIIPYIVSRETAKFGKVAISANAFDELFFGYQRTQNNFSYQARNHIFRQSLLGYDNSDKIFDDNIDERLSQGRWYELMTYVQYDLNKTLDAASMCFGLEVRTPALDHRLVEMALSRNESLDRNNNYNGKATLKKMLSNYGFDGYFLNRSKLGFSLHKEPLGMDALAKNCMAWCIKNGFLVNCKMLSGRDLKYLQMASLNFFFWYKVWSNKIL